MQDLGHGFEPGREDGERVGVGPARQRHADQRLEVPAAGGGVDERDEAGDHAGLAQPAHAVGRGVGAQAHGRAEVAPGQAPVLTEEPEDLAVDRVQGHV